MLLIVYYVQYQVYQDLHPNESIRSLDKIAVGIQHIFSYAFFKPTFVIFFLDSICLIAQVT